MLGKAAIISLLVIGLAYYFRSGSDVRDGIVVKTGTGPVKGSIVSSRDGRDYYAWHRIPFAKPPLGDLRFADPVPVDKWTEVIDGRLMGPACAQVDYVGFMPTPISGTEDCLHLNVFVPKELHHDIVEGKTPKHPVIVYIHGGGYVGGSSKMGDPGYFMDEDVIYASINYRLDILGFLTTGDKTARGNQGLKDQTMALKWIKENIEQFGGDPNQITLFGTSGGAASVHQQMLSPLSKGLFHGVFAQSGAASNTWGLATVGSLVEKTKTIAGTLSCPTDENQKMVDCLRKIDLETFLQPRLKTMADEMLLMKPHLYGEFYSPIVEAVKDERAFITEHPLKIIADGKSHRVPLFIGHTTHEGLIAIPGFKRDLNNIAKFEAEQIPALKVIFDIAGPKADAIASKIYGRYFPKDTQLSFDEKIKRYVDLFGDAFFNFDIRESVRLQRKFSPVYYYIHNNTDVPNLYGIFGEVTGEWPILLEVAWALLKSYVKENIFGINPHSNGINHAADLTYYFPMEELFMFIRKGDRNYQYSKDLVNLAVEFAKGSTKLEFRGAQVTPTPSEGSLKVIEFKNDGAIQKPEPFKERMDFLSSLKIRP